MKLLKITFLLSFTLIPAFATTRFRNNYSPSSHIITVIGTGYVGLITGACFADLGYVVICADNDINKINHLNSGVVPIYEPGLDQLIMHNVNEHRLSFTSDVDEAIEHADVLFIAVGTPMGNDGYADLTAFDNVISQIMTHLDSYKLICIKSTVPLGTADSVIRKMHENGIDSDFYDIVSNPEFLREGSAIHDFLHPDRIIIGTHSHNARICMQELYASLIKAQVPCFFTNLASAEMIKYASNAFLATKLSFINEIANLCDCTDADIMDVTYGMGLDSRINPHFLKPGPGFGGSCFPKDCNALCKMGSLNRCPLHLVETALIVNEKQKRKPVEKLEQLLNGEIEGKVIAILGLAFKNNTDDIRYSPAITSIEILLAKRALIKAYDPAAIENMKALFPQITYEESAYDALSNADAAIIITEWDEFKTLDLIHIKKIMKTPIIVDARNLLDPVLLKKYNFCFSMLGRN